MHKKNKQFTVWLFSSLEGLCQ